MSGKRILLIVGGGIAAYKCLDLVRRLRERGHEVRAVMTAAAQQFITPLSLSALTNQRVFSDLFNLDDEHEIGHIRLARHSDIIVVAPATADLIAKMANGFANDLATAILLATDKPVLVAPAMNPHMWRHPATSRNVKTLIQDGVHIIGPAHGEMAESGEAGDGRLVEVPDLVAKIDSVLGNVSSTNRGPLAGKHVLVTAGPTHEAIDPVRYIANRSSGKQGYAIAGAAARAGARVTLISGPVSEPAPTGVDIINITSAGDMLGAVTAALPADIAIFTAAVADWRVTTLSKQKIKKTGQGKAPALSLTETTDILQRVAKLTKGRPRLVIGFAAETENVVAHAVKKLASKGADWIVANDVSATSPIPGGVMGSDRNIVHVVTSSGADPWPDMSKHDVAERLIAQAAGYLSSLPDDAL